MKRRVCTSRYYLDGSLFNLQCLQERLIWDLLFADNAALIAYTERALWSVMSCSADGGLLFSLKVSLKKTEVLH